MTVTKRVALQVCRSWNSHSLRHNVDPPGSGLRFVNWISGAAFRCVCVGCFPKMPPHERLLITRVPATVVVRADYSCSAGDSRAASQ